jgi:hypothetical protein
VTVPFLQVKPKAIKLKVSPRFPAQLLSGIGTSVRKASGNYTVDLNYNDFAQAVALPPGTLFTLIWEPTSQQYILVPLSLVVGVNEAPADGSTYGRNNLTWVKALPLSGGTLTGALILAADPTTALGAATKQYTDSKAATVAPLMDGAAAVGASGLFARQDHVHPSDTTRMATVGGQTITGGFKVTPSNAIGTVTTGTVTPDPFNGNYQFYTNNGAHTLAAPASDCAIDILVTNGASAGAITFSGFTVGAIGAGDALTTTNTQKFLISIRRINAIATYSIKALQ